MTPQIDYYLRRFRQGDRDNAFHGLLEMEHTILPDLMTLFQTESDSRVREFLVEVIWQHRQQAAIPFLGQTLLDSNPQVWRQALDGLVALASPAALDALRDARTRRFPRQLETEEFRRWLEEAIEQAEAAVKG